MITPEQIAEEGLTIKDHDRMPLTPYKRKSILLYYRTTLGYNNLTFSDDDILQFYQLEMEDYDVFQGAAMHFGEYLEESINSLSSQFNNEDLRIELTKYTL